MKDWAEPAYHWAATLALIAAGIWAWTRFRQARQHETAMRMKVDCKRVNQQNDSRQIHLTVTITNIGGTRIGAKPRIHSGIDRVEPAYADDDERLEFSCSLQMKRLKTTPPGNEQAIGWFSPGAFESDDPLVNVNLLEEFEIHADGTVDFWMEPSEVQEFTRLLCLTKGSYLGKITFVGLRTDSDFWAHVFYLDTEA